MASKRKPTEKKPNTPQLRIRGKVETAPLADVQPNTWNPNEVPEHVMRSIEHGFKTDGWLASQALLIWGSDEKGEDKNIIIDGEHRWTCGRNVGMVEAPMVFLDGLSEAEAKALTIKMNQKRGDWNPDGLAKLLHELEHASEDMALDLGFNDDQLAKFLASSAEEMAPPLDDAPPVAAASAPAAGEQAAPTPPPPANVRMVQLYLDETTHPAFMEDVRKLAERWGLKNTTDTVLRAIREARETGSERP